MEKLTEMPPKLIRFSALADSWFTGHRWVRPSKIKSIVLHKSGEIYHQKDGCQVLITGITNKRKLVKIYIKFRETEEANLIDVLVIKIHAGRITKKIEDF